MSRAAVTPNYTHVLGARIVDRTVDDGYCTSKVSICGSPRASKSYAFSMTFQHLPRYVHVLRRVDFTVREVNDSLIGRGAGAGPPWSDRFPESVLPPAVVCHRLPV